jgi:hypothetical protein
MANDAQLKIDTAKRRGIPVELLMPKLVAPSGGRGQGAGAGGGSSDAGIGQGLERKIDDIAERLDRLDDKK